jgi:hypothetical protein
MCSVKPSKHVRKTNEIMKNLWEGYNLEKNRDLSI